MGNTTVFIQSNCDKFFCCIFLSFTNCFWNFCCLPKTCAYVGDTYSRDVIGPQNLGFGATFHIHSFLTQSRDGDVPKNIRATYTIQDIYEVYTILKEQAC